MSRSAPLVRLHLLLDSQGLSRALDRLTVLGIVPRKLEFRRAENGLGRLVLDLDTVPTDAVPSLMARLEQIPAVAAVQRGSLSMSVSHRHSTLAQSFRRV